MSALVTPSPATSDRTLRRWAVRAHRADRGVLLVVMLLALCGVLFFYGLPSGELWGNESLRALVAAEMLRTGDWVVPRLYGEPLLTKPPGMYIAIALCSLPLGSVTEFSARLPSALAATVTVFLVYWYFGQQLGRRGGFVAALMLPLSWLWLEKASAGDIDMLLVAWTTAAILCLLRALDAEKAQRWWLLALLCVAGGFLTKWTTPAFFYATAVPLLWWRGQLRLLWSRQHLAAAALAGLVCLAWLAAVVVQVGLPTFAATLEQEALQRLVPSYQGRPYPWAQTLLHPLRMLVVALPFSALAPLTLWPGFGRLWDERGRRLLVGLHCWTWPNLLLWSLPTEHKPHFSFPLLPGMSGLAAMVLLAWMKWYDRVARPESSKGVGAVATTPFEDSGRATVRWSGLAWLRRLRPVHLLVAVLLVWLALKVGYAHGLIHNRGHGQSARAAGELLARLVPVDRVLFLLGIKDDGILFYYGRPAQRLGGPGQVAGAPAYCLVTETALRSWQAGKDAEVVQEMTDAQGAPIFLVRVTAS